MLTRRNFLNTLTAGAAAALTARSDAATAQHEGTICPA